MLLAPTPRPVLLAGVVASACLRALLPATFLLVVALALGVGWPGLAELALAAVLVMGLAAATACYSTLVALRFRTQQAAPLMQMGRSSRCSSRRPTRRASCCPDGCGAIADVNPVTHVLEGVRQGFVGDVTLGRHVAGDGVGRGLVRRLRRARRARHEPSGLVVVAEQELARRARAGA